MLALIIITTICTLYLSLKNNKVRLTYSVQVLGLSFYWQALQRLLCFNKKNHKSNNNKQSRHTEQDIVHSVNYYNLLTIISSPIKVQLVTGAKDAHILYIPFSSSFSRFNSVKTASSFVTTTTEIYQRTIMSLWPLSLINNNYYC